MYKRLLTLVPVLVVAALAAAAGASAHYVHHDFGDNTLTLSESATCTVAGLQSVSWTTQGYADEGYTFTSPSSGSSTFPGSTSGWQTVKVTITETSYYDHDVYGWVKVGHDYKWQITHHKGDVFDTNSREISARVNLPGKCEPAPEPAPVPEPAGENSFFLCYSVFQFNPGVWPYHIAAELMAGGGYWQPYAVKGNVPYGTNIGDYHLVCNLATGQAAGQQFAGAGGDVSGPEAYPALKGQLGWYPLVP